MTLGWHRQLRPGDVALAHQQLNTHVPMNWRGSEICASATHLVNAQVWPCHVAQWSRSVLAAEERGEVAGGADA